MRRLCLYLCTNMPLCVKHVCSSPYSVSICFSSVCKRYKFNKISRQLRFSGVLCILAPSINRKHAKWESSYQRIPPESRMLIRKMVPHGGANCALRLFYALHAPHSGDNEHASHEIPECLITNLTLAPTPLFNRSFIAPTRAIETLRLPILFVPFFFDPV